MKILFATLGYKPAYKIGGPIIATAELAENLLRRGHKVVVFTSNSNLDENLDVPVNQPITVDGVEVWYFEHQEPIKKYLPFIPYLSQSIGYLYSPELRGVLNNYIQTFDVVHTHMPFVYPTFAAGMAAINNHIPLFYQQSGAFAPGYLNYRALKKRVYIYFFEKKLMQKAAFLMALNEAEVSSYKSLGIKTPSRIVTNGVNIPVIKKSLPAEYNVKDYPAILPDDFVILFLARLHTIKGPDFLLDVFIKLSQKYPKARLIIAGPDQHNLTQILINRITEVGIGSRVLIPGMISGDKKQQLIERADLFCAPSSAEGFSISVLEAMSNRTPVMITPECNFPAVEENSAGWIIEKNMEKWAEKISWLIENPAELLARGERGYELVKNSYTWEKVVDKLEAVYLEGIKKQLSDREK